MSTPQGAAAASCHSVTGFSVQPEDIVCQCGAQLAYLLRPAHNEPAVNGLETLAAVSGTARAGVCVCHYERVRECVNSMALSLWAFFQPGDEMGKFFLRGGKGVVS